MSKKNENFVTAADFTGLLEKMTVKRIELNPLYVKAYLDRNEKPSSEYDLNTTTWD